MTTYKTKRAVLKLLNDLSKRAFLFKHSTGWSVIGYMPSLKRKYTRPDYNPKQYPDGWGIEKTFYWRAEPHSYPPVTTTTQRVDLKLVKNADGHFCLNETVID